MQKAEKHFLANASRRLEAMGLAVGEVCINKGQKFIFISDYVTAQNDASAVSVRFSTSAFSELVRQYREHGSALILGWAHSHPGYGCFLSSTDITTQRNYFPEAFNIALVADPLKKEGQHMLWRAFRLKDNDYEEIPFAVVVRK